MTRNQNVFTTIAASALLAVLLFSAPTTASALIVTNLAPNETIGLATIIDDGLAVQIGDKQFGDFIFSYIDNNFNTTDDLTRSNVTLTALANDIGFGLSFQQPLLALGTSIKDVGFKYSVTVTDPNFMISDIHLSITGSAGNGGSGNVGEDVYVGGFGVTQVGSIQASIPGVSTDAANIVPPVTELWVQKNVRVTGGGAANGFASITIIDQTFSQIPEPSTVLLVGLGLLGVVALKRTRQS